MIFVGVGSNNVTQSKDENRYEKPSLLHCCEISGGQTGEWALVQEEQMGPLLTPGKISLNR